MESKYDSLYIKNTPLRFIVDFLEEFNREENISLEFSIYKSGGQGKTIYRKKIKINKYFIESIHNLEKGLQQDEELAINSRIFIDKKIRYIPLCDFSFHYYNQMKSYIYDLSNYLNANIYIYNSGRSHHMYCLKVLTLREWSKYCGHLLLLNPPDKPFYVVDSRWVGHSLEQGFGALRLTANSSFYIQQPCLKEIVKANRL
jgi:hypothetical protein